MAGVGESRFEQFGEAADKLKDQAKEIEDLLNGKSGFGSLAVGATLTIGNYLATLLIGSFMQRHPESQVKLHVQNTANIVQQVAHYEIDLGLIEGDRVSVASAAGRIVAVARPDPTLRPGMVSITHCWGEGSDDDDEIPESTSRLVSSDSDIQTINGMPIMTAIPVEVLKIAV